MKSGTVAMVLSAYVVMVLSRLLWLLFVAKVLNACS